MKAKKREIQIKSWGMASRGRINGLQVLQNIEVWNILKKKIENIVKNLKSEKSEILKIQKLWFWNMKFENIGKKIMMVECWLKILGILLFFVSIRQGPTIAY
jgi:hypothetical protein